MAHTGLADDTFFRSGGTELAPMSTTLDPVVAVQYAASAHALVLKLRTSSFMDRGADVAWCSAFPAEREVLYPPLTYLRPSGKRECVKHGTVVMEVVEVVPCFGT